MSGFSNPLLTIKPEGENNLNFHGFVKLNLNNDNKEYYFFSKQNKSFKKFLGLKEIVKKTVTGGYYKSKPKTNNKQTKNKIKKTKNKIKKSKSKSKSKTKTKK